MENRQNLFSDGYLNDRRDKRNDYPGGGIAPSVLWGGTPSDVFLRCAADFPPDYQSRNFFFESGGCDLLAGMFHCGVCYALP